MIEVPVIVKVHDGVVIVAAWLKLDNWKQERRTFMLWKKLRAIDAGYLLTKLSKRFVYVSWVSIKTTKYFKKLLFL